MVSGLLSDWADDTAARIFASNIEQDRPLAQRQAEFTTLRERIGEFAADTGRPAECESPAHCRWWLTGPGGTVAVQIKLAPLREPLVQQLTVAVPPARGSALGTALDQVVDALNAAASSWPADLATADGFDSGRALRELRMAAAWAGPATIDCYVGGNGTTGTTVRLTGPTGKAVLAVEISESGELRRAEVTLTS
jgi:hypothetical protein